MGLSFRGGKFASGALLLWSYIGKGRETGLLLHFLWINDSAGSTDRIKMRKLSFMRY